MFGPNATVSPQAMQPPYHHRGPAAMALLGDLDELFREQVLGAGWQLAFVPGSGTLGLESLAHAFGDGQNVATEGEFSTRLGSMISDYGWWSLGGLRWAVQYETAESREDHRADAELWDCVSSFPYYDVPAQASAFVTVSSKQLGAEPIVAVVGVRDRVRFDCEGCSSYLCLARWLRATKERRFWHTPPLSALSDLKHGLLGHDTWRLRKTIDARRGLLKEAAPGLQTIGDGPVLTYEHLPARVVAGWDLYVTKTGWPQVFLWSGTDAEYESFASVLKELP